MDSIGTGEGAQAYGHGLYFADSRGVAENYRDTLTSISNDALGGFVVPDSAVPYLRSVAEGPDPILAGAADELLIGDFSPSQIKTRVAEWADAEGVDVEHALSSFDELEQHTESWRPLPR